MDFVALPQRRGYEDLASNEKKRIDWNEGVRHIVEARRKIRVNLYGQYLVSDNNPKSSLLQNKNENNAGLGPKIFAHCIFRKKSKKISKISQTV